MIATREKTNYMTLKGNQVKASDESNGFPMILIVDWM